MYRWVLVTFALATIIGSIVGTTLVVRHDRRRPAFALGVFVLLIALWLAADFALVAARTVQWKLFSIQVSYICVASVPVAYLVFALRYTDRGDWLSIRRIAVLSVIPALTVSLVFTAQFHSLFYSGFVLVDGARGPILAVFPGPWYYVNVGYSYGLLLVSTGLVVAEAFTTNRLYRWQSIILTVCVLVPWSFNALFLLGVRPLANADPTPIGFIAVSVPFAIIVQRTELTRAVPIAHERIFRTFTDPVVVYGAEGTVIDSNRAARELFAPDGSTVAGEPVTDLLPPVLLANDGLRSDLDDAFECVIDHDGERRQYVARRRDVYPDLTPVSRGSLLVLMDVTRRKEQRAALEDRNRALASKTEQLERKNDQLERLADVTSHDLATPLSTGENLLSLLRADHADDPSIEQSLSDLETVHERLREFAAALPELARGSTDVEAPVECDLASVARSAWTVVETDDLRLITKRTLVVEGDPHRLKQAFENLFRNAVEHGSKTPLRRIHTTTDPGSMSGADGSATDGSTGSGGGAATDDDFRSSAGPRRTPRSIGRSAGRGRRSAAGTDPVPSTSAEATTVTVGRFGQAVADERAGFYVKDDGRGIPDHHKEGIFEFGVGSGSGTGYGLAIVRTIVESHGWSLAVTDSATDGARFEIVTSPGGE